MIALKLELPGAGKLVLRATLKGHNSTIYGVGFFDARKCATGSYDDTGKVWDTETGQCLYTYTGHGSNDINDLTVC